VGDMVLGMMYRPMTEFVIVFLRKRREELFKRST
jgi:hypothetical protein